MLTVQVTVLVVPKRYHLVCILLCSRMGATAVLVEQGILTVVCSNAERETVGLKMPNLRQKKPKWLDRQRSKASTTPKVSQRKSSLTLPPYCVRASLRWHKTMASASSMYMS